MFSLPPVFIFSTGRCGSTMVSDVLNRHPRILSLSEFFSFIGLRTFLRRRVSGPYMWRLYSRQQYRTRFMLQGRYEELLYPVDAPEARFSQDDVPPILCATLPHLTDRYEALFDELGPAVRGQSRQSPADHFRRHFEWLGERFNRSVWAERSGGSLLFASRLLRQFPEARVIHVYRDGRETALSMSNHYLFRMIVATMRAFPTVGIDMMELMARGKHWDRVSPWLEPFVSAFFRPERLLRNKLTLTDFATFWSGMIERGQRVFSRLPPERLLNLRFEDVQANPEEQLRRLIRFISPQLEDEAWLREASAIPRQTPSRFAKLEPAEQDAVARACRPGLELLGYPL